MLEVAYPDSPIVAQDQISAWAAAMPGTSDPEAPGVRDVWDFENGPAPGERAGDTVLPDGRRLHEIIRGTAHSLLLFDGAVASPEGYKRMAEIARSVLDRYGPLIVVHMITPRASPPAELEWIGPLILDAEGTLHRHYGARSECLYLIRPDKHVAYRCQPADGQKLLEYLGRIFL
jgi:hypothetical protein